MTKLKLRDKRKKAQFGESIVAAGIQAAATAASAIMGAAATAKASKEQAAAQEANAKSEAEALQAQNENNNRLQKQQIEATKLENEKIRTLEESNQETLQMLAGMQNTNARKDAAKIQAKYGTRIQKEQVIPSFDGNMPVITKDGGILKYLGKTSAGDNKFLAIGDKHYEKHKAKNGKVVGGIGLQFPTIGNSNKTDVEVEGGEVVTVGPNDAKVFSAHDMKGINPAKLVLNGANPDEVFSLQEIAKQQMDIKDNGKKTNMKRKKHTAGGIVQPFPPQPNLLLAGTTTPIGGIIASQKQDIPQLKYGGRVKAAEGLKKVVGTYGTYFNPDKYLYKPIDNKNNNKSVTKSTNFLDEANKATKTAGWINGAGQFIGSAANTIGNWFGTKASERGLRAASDEMRKAINKMHGIDLSLISANDFKRVGPMAAIEAPIVNTGAQRAGIERGLARANERIDQMGASSAASLNRKSMADINAQDAKNKIAEDAANLVHDIHQKNAQTITDVSKTKEMLDAESSKDFLNTYIDAIKFNAEVDNTKADMLGKTNANEAQGLADIKSTRIISNAQNWGNLATNLGDIGSKTADTIGKNKFNYLTTMLGANADTRIDAWIESGDTDSLLNYYNTHLKDIDVTSETMKHRKQMIENILKNKNLI